MDTLETHLNNYTIFHFLFFKLWIVTKQLKEKERYLLINELSCAANMDTSVRQRGNQGKNRYPSYPRNKQTSCAALQEFCQIYTPKFTYEPKTVQIFHCVNSSVTLIAPQFQMFDVLNVTSFCASKWVLMFARPITTVFKYQEPATMFC